jgi:alpha-beta hydrolase superfamily lysophospholipase
MRHLTACFITILLCGTLVLSQTHRRSSQVKSAPKKAGLPTAAPILTPALCGAGTYVASLGTQSLGRETFEINCTPEGGFRATGHTRLDVPGGPSEFDTSLDLDKSGAPQKYTAKGSAGGQTIDLAITINKEMATVVDKGQSKDVPYHGAAIFSPNVSYIYQFVLSRYDAGKGGVQKIPLFPSGELTLERTARDIARPTGGASPASFDRYSLQIGPASMILWTDAKGRLAVIDVPAQGVKIIREDYQAFADPLHAELLASVKSLATDYGAPPNADFLAKEVLIPVKNYKLAGTLLLPLLATGKAPAVVMSTGSGQQRRDEQLPLKGFEEYRPFRQIAELLATRGIAVLRCDDRGVGDSTGLDTLGSATTMDFADDVRAQIAYLRTRADIDPNRIAVLGHSEGGIIAPLIAASDKQLAAIILMAGPAKRGEDILRFQLNYASDTDPKLSRQDKQKKRQENDEYLKAALNGGDVTKYSETLRMLAGPWGRAFLAYDPLVTIRKVRQPILILQGGLDKQVTPDQAPMLANAARQAGNKDVTVRVFPNLNHLFLPARTGAETEYASLTTKRLGNDVLRMIADWTKIRLKAFDKQRERELKELNKPESEREKEMEKEVERERERREKERKEKPKPNDR